MSGTMFQLVQKYIYYHFIALIEVYFILQKSEAWPSLKYDVKVDFITEMEHNLMNALQSEELAKCGKIMFCIWTK